MMPRGIPKLGYRIPRKVQYNSSQLNELFTLDTPTETDDQIAVRIKDRFEIFEDLTESVVKGKARALVVSGPSGVGKTYTLEQHLKHLNPRDYKIVRGFTRATGLYRSLYEMKDKNKIVIFDDCDDVFHDDTQLNILKAACDSQKVRTISWMSETKMRDDDDDLLPTRFDFEGSMIFITNQDFDKIIDQGGKLSPHIKALVSRAHYIDLTLKTRRDYLVRIKQVIASGMQGTISPGNETKILEYLEENYKSLRELSLRLVYKMNNVIDIHPTKWKKILDMTEKRA